MNFNKLQNKYYLSIFLLIFSILSGQMIRIPITGKIILVSDLAVALFLFWYGIKFRGKLKDIKKHYLFWPIIFFITAAIASLIFALPSLGAGKVLIASLYLARWILYAMIIFAVSLFPDKDKTKKSIFWAIIISATILSLAGFIQLIVYPDFANMVKFGWDPHRGRLLSTWFDPNLLAGYFIVAMGFLAAKALSQFSIFNSQFSINDQFSIFKKSLKIDHWKFNENWKLEIKNFALLFFVAVSYLAIVLTYSRSGYLALAIIFLVLFLCSPLLDKDGVRRRFLWKFFFLGIIVAIATLLIFPRSYQRMQGAVEVDVTSQMRIDSWKDTDDIIKKHPIFGVGFNALQWQWNIDRPDHAKSGSDSSLLTIWATTGILGLAAYLWVFWSILAKQFRVFKSDCDISEKTFSIGVFAAVIGILVHSMFVNSLLYPHIMLVIWVFVASS